MDLPFDERKLLLPGVHDVTMDTVKEHFGRFQKSDRRMKLFDRLIGYVSAVKQAKCGQGIVINGSFVMACIDEPEDIDLVLILPDGWDREAKLRPFQYNLVSKRDARREYRFDVFSVEPGSAEEAEWIDYFGKVGLKWRDKFGWPPDTRKGLVRVML